MIDFKPGDVALVQLPFTDLSGTKRRPAVIVNHAGFSRKYGDFVLIPLTSQRQSNAAFALTDWRGSGLLKATWVKPVVVTLNASLIVRVIGALTESDHAAVRAALREVFAAPFLGE